MKIEETLKNNIIEQYGSVRAFALQHDIPYTTVVSVIKRGIDNSSTSTIVRICDALNLSSHKLVEGHIVFKSDLLESKKQIIDLNDLVSSCKWTLQNNQIKLNEHFLTDQDLSTLSIALDIGLEMIKKQIN